MYDLTAMGELLIDFTQLSTDGEGYPCLLYTSDAADE